MVTHVKFLPNETSKGHQVLASVGDISCRFWDIFSQQRARELLAISQHDIDYEVMEKLFKLFLKQLEFS